MCRDLVKMIGIADSHDASFPITHFCQGTLKEFYFVVTDQYGQNRLFWHRQELLTLKLDLLTSKFRRFHAKEWSLEENIQDFEVPQDENAATELKSSIKSWEQTDMRTQ